MFSSQRPQGLLGRLGLRPRALGEIHLLQQESWPQEGGTADPRADIGRKREKAKSTGRSQADTSL